MTSFEDDDPTDEGGSSNREVEGSGPTLGNGVPIRVVGRSMAVLQALNAHGTLTMARIAEEASIPYATAIRIVQTLIHEGLVVRERDSPVYRATALVLALSHGYSIYQRMFVAARPHIISLTALTGWPVTVTTRVGARMVIGENTHLLTPFRFNVYKPGYSFPILESSSGLAYLAFAEERERRVIVQALQDDPDAIGKQCLELVCTGPFLDRIRHQGYAVKERNRYTENPGKTSSVSVPIFLEGRLLGVAALTFFASALRVKDAVEKFVDPLRKTTKAIETSLTSAEPAKKRRAL